MLVLTGLPREELVIELVYLHTFGVTDLLHWNSERFLVRLEVSNLNFKVSLSLKRIGHLFGAARLSLVGHLHAFTYRKPTNWVMLKKNYPIASDRFLYTFSAS